MRTFYCLAILSLTLLSCSDSSKTDREVIKEMEKSLEKSTSYVNSNKLQRLRKLQEDKVDPITAEKAGFWFAVADTINQLSENAYKSIQSIKKLDKISSSNVDILIKELKQVESKLLASDKKIEAEFSHNTLFQKDSINKIHKKLLTSDDKESQLAYLTNIKYRFSLFESHLITFCAEQYTRHLSFLDNFYPAIVTQNATLLKPGEKLEITAGIGMFTRVFSPVILINGNEVDLKDHTYSTTKLKVPDLPGKYSVPVKIKFTDQNGIEQAIEEIINYTVAKECGQ